MMPHRPSLLCFAAALLAAPAAAAQEAHFVAGDFGVPIGGRVADPSALGFAPVSGVPGRNRWRRTNDSFWREIGYTSLDNGIVVALGAARFYEGQPEAAAFAACRTDLARVSATLVARFPRLQRYARLERLLYPNGGGHEFVERMTAEGRDAGRRISLSCSAPHPGPVAPHSVMLTIGYGIDDAEFDAAEAAPR